MSYEVLEKEIKTLPKEYIDELEDFVTYLKLKAKFAEFENIVSENIELKLDEADLQVKENSVRFSHEEVFSATRSQIAIK